MIKSAFIAKTLLLPSSRQQKTSGKESLIYRGKGVKSRVDIRLFNIFSTPIHSKLKRPQCQPLAKSRAENK